MIFSQKIYLTDLLSRSAETSVLIAETEISREEQKLARNSQGLPGTEEKKKKKKPITAEIEEPFDTKHCQKRA